MKYPQKFFRIKASAFAVKTVLLTASIFSNQSWAEELKVIEKEKLKNIEVITITNQRHHLGLENNESYAQGKTTEPDLANWLTSVPGANVNSNGPVTGIAQYRGLYGDRISATLNGHTIIGAGPNAMDTPLSYSTPLIVDAMTVYRGIAPVSVGMNTLGGAIDITMRKAEATHNHNWQTTGDIQTGIRSNNNAGTLSSVVNLAKGDFAGLFYGNWQAGDSMESGKGDEISPTDFEKRQFGTDLRFFGNASEAGFTYHYTDTQDSGTPALPMDIEYIFSHRLNLDGQLMLGAWQANWLLGYIDADHGMTNFLMRTNDDPTKYRRNNASATTTDFKLTLEQTFSYGDLRIGVDGYLAEHDSVITNPNNMMFEVVNFNGVEDNRFGAFIEWHQQYDATQVQLGLRYKRAEANADEVATSMAMMMQMPNDMDMDMGMGNDMDMDSGMGMDDNMDINDGMDMDGAMPMPTMSELAIDLRDGFNHADRSVTDNNVDIALSIDTQLSDMLSLYIGLGLKNRAPSYQERYLWTPMEATGGLADGNTYIGNINLKSETAQQLDLGLTYQSKSARFAPHIFYQKIDDYIQGIPLGMNDMSASMMANMMSGDDNPLQFNNVDAKLYGVDLDGYVQVDEHFRISAIVSYVRGERRDISDNLYRIAPLNGQVNASFSNENWSTNLAFVFADSTDNVSVTNDEQTSAGYGLINVDLQYYVNNQITLRAGVDNVFDKEYRNHLGGYNRVKGTDISVMDRLPSEGISGWAELTYTF
ncbi:TonB-dependent receptor [Colwellia sp. 1_MG-2023]|uniref:TonB-dependent receptor n=1 Tax=Colwellia sp. 1_MG-2023 TaxID=3062649 RepID=UPI0026E42DB0|nr:TonB-dependent receptor [Colwellia sp. 1_MG-2023]MDO6445073.1 TonB-dependent receptor [Colwellia sp. 1_MG-2023]